MTKLPINKNIPLVTEDALDAFGAPAFGYVKEGKWPYIFDRYWRKIPAKYSNSGGRFATEEERELALPITDALKAYVLEDPTDRTNYDYLFNIGEVENETPAEGSETAEPNTEENAPTISVASPKWPALLRIAAKALNEMADALE